MTAPKIEAVAWAEYAENGNARIWSGDLAAWEAVSSERTKPRNPVPLYSQQTVDALLAEVERLDMALDVLATVNSQAIENYERAEAQAEANRRDAERYRWLRDEAWDHPAAAPACSLVDTDGRALKSIDGEDMDAAIDAAIGGREGSPC